MEPEIDRPQPEAPLAGKDTASVQAPHAIAPALGERIFHWIDWVFVGNQGLRAGWSALILFFLTLLFMAVLGTLAAVIFKPAHYANPNLLTPKTALIIELIQLPALLAAGFVVAYIERRRILDYNLTGPRRLVHFVSGLAAGFVALSVLVGALNYGGWLHIGPAMHSGAQIFIYAAIWGLIFLLTGFYEEGGFRCFLQSILTRGINFWWAAGAIGLACLLLALLVKGNCVWGVYAMALLGLLPCLMLHIRKTPRNGFWQAAWVTSTFFGLIHITNNGENWIGIFAAAMIGLVFCVSVRLTGTAWWAIGCHASWNWAETFFYGTADSGMVATRHFLTSTPLGNALWSGGSDGPEGSLLVIGVILLLLAALLAIYGRKRATVHPVELAVG